MDNSVIISSVMSRIEYYMNTSGISSDVEKEYIKNKISLLENNQTQPLLLYIKRLLQSFNIAMGEKRTTAKMYLERDLKYLDEMEKQTMSKNKGRNFVHTMNPKVKPEEGNTNNMPQIDDSGVSHSHILTKKSQDSNAYKLYSDAA